MKKCLYCGEEINDAAIFCKYCGKRQDLNNENELPLNNTDSIFEEDELENENAEKLFSKKMIMIIGVLVSLTVIVGVIATIMIIQKPDDGVLSHKNSETKVAQENNNPDSSEKGEDIAYHPGAYDEYGEDFKIIGSDERYIEYSDYSYMDLDDVQWAINEIYARHGRIFKDEPYFSFFKSCAWFEPTYYADEFDESWLNDIERSNVNTLAEYRNELRKKEEEKSSLFNETIWTCRRGQTLGGQSLIQFHTDETFSEYSFGTDELVYDAGTWSYDSSNETLYLYDTALYDGSEEVFVKDGDSFRSVDTVEMMVGEDYVWISPGTDNQGVFN